MDRRTRSVELRAQTEGDTVVGHAAVFGQYANLGDRLETIDRHAFDRALAERHDVFLTVGHDLNKVLARTKAGTLSLSVDEVGLRMRADLPDTSLGRDTRLSLERGDLDSMSFMFVPTASELERKDGRVVERITDLTLYDVSIVSVPAYQGTDVRLRAYEQIPVAPPGRPVRLIRAKARLTLTEG